MCEMTKQSKHFETMINFEVLTSSVGKGESSWLDWPSNKDFVHFFPLLFAAGKSINVSPLFCPTALVSILKSSPP